MGIDAIVRQERIPVSGRIFDLPPLTGMSNPWGLAGPPLDRI